MRLQIALQTGLRWSSSMTRPLSLGPPRETLLAAAAAARPTLSSGRLLRRGSGRGGAAPWVVAWWSFRTLWLPRTPPQTLSAAPRRCGQTKARQGWRGRRGRGTAAAGGGCGLWRLREQLHGEHRGSGSRSTTRTDSCRAQRRQSTCCRRPAGLGATSGMLAHRGGMRHAARSPQARSGTTRAVSTPWSHRRWRPRSMI